MRNARFAEHQIITVIKSVKAGRTVKDVCREAGISEATDYNWKYKHGDIESSDIKKIKDLEDENRSRTCTTTAQRPLMMSPLFSHYKLLQNSILDTVFLNCSMLYRAGIE